MPTSFDKGGPEDPKSGDSREPMVEIEAVRRSFSSPGGGRIVALELSRLAVGRGEICALVGPNGAGKSTLLHLVAGLLRPDTGVIKVGGVSLNALREAELDRFRAHNVGVLLQGAQLMDCLTAEENVMAALHFAGKGRSEQRARARSLLEEHGVAHRARHLPSAMSGGERQRVALARALANRPPLLLADEPLASLDSEGAQALAALFASLTRQQGLTLLVATHHPQRLQPDRVVQLRAAQGLGSAA